jgi:hypothetical protein
MSETPKRIQRSRAKGWRMPEGAVYVGRPTGWGNPWKAEVVQGVGWCCTDTRNGLVIQARDRADAHDLAVAHYRARLEGSEPAGVRDAAIAELRGRDLACWCPLDMPCHADVLLELANAPGTNPTRSGEGADA